MLVDWETYFTEALVEEKDIVTFNRPKGCEKKVKDNNSIIKKMS